MLQSQILGHSYHILFQQELDNATNNFYPPQKQLSFNIQLKSNDGLLTSYISEVEKISYEKANRKIQKQVVQLKSRLKKGETIDFKYIGALSPSKQGILVFNPSDHLNYMTGSFWIDPFHVPLLFLEKLLLKTQNQTEL